MLKAFENSIIYVSLKCFTKSTLGNLSFDSRNIKSSNNDLRNHLSSVEEYNYQSNLFLLNYSNSK